MRRADRWKTKSTIWVRPTWVGPDEWEGGGSHYRVIHTKEAIDGNTSQNLG